jgi:hypothetical protein
VHTSAHLPAQNGNDKIPLEVNFFLGGFFMQNVLGAISVLAKIGNAGGKVLENGKVGMEDIVVLPDVAMLFPVAAAVKWPEAVAEAKALTVEQADQCVAHFKEVFDIPQDNVEVKIEKIVEAIEKVAVLSLQIVDTVKVVIELVKKPEEAPAA